MKFILERVSDPEIEPVDLARMKRELGEFVALTNRDDDITALIVAGREWVEDYTGRALIDQSWRLTIDQGAGVVVDRVRGYNGPGYYVGRFIWAATVGNIVLRKSPALAITSFKSVDSDGVETDIDASTFELREADSKWPKIVALSGATWTGAQLLRLVFRAGFADRTGSPVEDASVVPERFKQAIILWVKAHYDCDPGDMPIYLKAAENMIRPERANLQFA